MTQEAIKSECEKIYAQIKKANKRLEEIRGLCPHPTTFDGNYSWRPGTIQLAKICSDCGKCIKIIQ